MTGAPRNHDVLGIVADDLTGAADAAAPFAGAGFVTRLALRDRFNVSDCDVLSVATDTRALSEAKARERVARIAGKLRQAGVERFFKKIDSTLRGNVVAELEALLEIIDPRTLVLVCPAFPAVGRTVVDGRLRVDGRSLLESDSARDPVAPVMTDRIDEMLARLGESISVPLSLVRAGGGELAATLADGSTRIAIVDAVDPADLTTIAAACARLDRPVVGVGSGGLAGAFARQQAVELTTMAGRVLVVVGSRHPRSREQLAELEQRPDTELCELDTSSMGSDRAWEEHALALRDRGRGVLALTTVLDASPADPERVASRLADVVVDLTNDGVRAIVATGGDVAGAILDRAQADSLEMIGEVVPGLPIGRIRGGSLTRTLIVTKSGGFGDPHALNVAVDAARRTPEVFAL